MLFPYFGSVHGESEQPQVASFQLFFGCFPRIYKGRDQSWKESPTNWGVWGVLGCFHMETRLGFAGRALEPSEMEMRL